VPPGIRGGVESTLLATPSLSSSERTALAAISDDPTAFAAISDESTALASISSPLTALAATSDESTASSWMSARRRAWPPTHAPDEPARALDSK
jgi:hypothetical protein